jgi:hypothetical protein
MTIETIIRPFLGGTDPLPFHPPGQKGTPLVKVQVGLKGGSKTFSWSGSGTQTNYMIRIHRESASVAAENG